LRRGSKELTTIIPEIGSLILEKKFTKNLKTITKE
jgi:hypothetical protein